MDLLGSILGSMQKPPTMGDAERKKAREQKALLEKQQEKEKKSLQEFREKIQKRIHDFIKDGTKQKSKFEPMDKGWRAIVHEVADVAGLTSFSFGIEEQDRYVMVWKKEFAPTDDEVNALRAGKEWDPEKAKELEKQRELERLSAEENSSSQKKIIPNSNYKDKYRHLIGDEAAKKAAKQTTANRSYGFVPSENKRDHRTIEEVLAETRAKKKLKTEALKSPVGGPVVEECSSLTANSGGQTSESTETKSTSV
ncbi:sperm-associated antigen 7 homolog [Saccostrea echinata]|uniref:sperm-associated antigen 7 homolog n=1 Tax=Saccostrea echinata TaxID=191078 RepID=UPI002A840261|nr:sperm-associated antigen 7 homolog [Saccostrea echinata]